MFVRIKTTPNSPRKSVQIVQSVRRGANVCQKIVRYVGIATNDHELEQLKMLAESIKIRLEEENQELLFSPEDLAKMKVNPPKKEISEEDYRVNIKDLKEEQRVVNGIHDIYGSLFDELRYNCAMKNPARNKHMLEIFKNIVLARIANPLSKKASIDMLEEEFGVSIDLHKVYRMMDKLDEESIQRIKNITYENTKNLFNGKIDIIFFDATTIYFEAFKEDTLRQCGYSKDLKFKEVQILLGLMVTKEGLPIGYEVFEGSKYEGHTVIPSLRKIKETYEIDKVVFVADQGMYNRENLEAMEKEGIEYIVGARIKNMKTDLKEEILKIENYRNINKDTKINELEIGKENRLILRYTAKRARKDRYERERAVKNLKKKIEGKKNAKEYLTNYGYKKYLTIEGVNRIKINEEKIKEAEKWDGIHGIITNSKWIKAEEAIEQYKNLWQVEEAFRITKHDLKVRPIYHWKPERIRAHIAISFTAYSLVKHLSYRIKLQYKKLSAENIRQILIKAQTSILYDNKKRIRYGLPSKISKDASKIYQALNKKYKLTPYIIKKM
ncbi:IS1634 family transposase [bacterium]